MPLGDAVNPIAEPLSQPEQRKILMPDQEWTNDHALQIVRSDFAYAEAFRTNAHDWRYRNADELYLGWQGQLYWEGTRVPRSSLGVPVAFMQIESLLPKLVPPLSNPDSFHFSSETDLGKDEETICIAWRELVLKQLDESRWRHQIWRACKSLAEYGNGVLEVGFEPYEEEYVRFKKITSNKPGILVHHPVAGPVMVPSGVSESFKRSVTSEKKERPYVRYVSVKDFFVDPNCENPILQDGAGYVIKRQFMRSEQVKALRNREGFTIPDDVYLTNLSKSKSTAQADVTKQTSELFRYNMWNPMQDYTSDPAQKRIAVIEYTTPSRKVWWLQGGEDSQSIIYNDKNRYRCINYWAVPWADVLDRFHALSICDVVEGEQRLEQAIVNARVDELALALHPPMNKRRGVTIPAYQLKTRPGVVREVENPESDVKQQEISNVTQQAFIEVEASERRTQKITGMSDLAALGTPSSGGNSANRTAAGIQTQAGATQDRVMCLIESVEDLLVEPVVNAVIRFDKKFLDITQAANWLKLDPRFQNLDPEKVMNARIVAECRGSVKMKARMAFLQAFPQFAQFALNPEFLQLMAMQNKETVDVKEIFHMFTEAINYAPRKPLIIPLTQQQIQAQSQPKPAEMLKAQVAQGQTQTKDKIDQRRSITKLVETLFKEMTQGHQKYAELDDKFLLGALQAHIDSQANRNGDGGEGTDSEAGD